MQIKDVGFTLKGVQEKILLILAIKPGGGGVVAAIYRLYWYVLL